MVVAAFSLDILGHSSDHHSNNAYHYRQDFLEYYSRVTDNLFEHRPWLAKDEFILGPSLEP